MTKSIDMAIQEYRTSGDGFDALFTRVVVRVYEYPKKNPLCTEEDCAEFLLSFYPRIKNIILGYRNMGREFDAYLANCLRWHMKSYLGWRLRMVKQDRLLLRESCDSARTGADDASAGEETPEYRTDGRSRIGPFSFCSRDGVLHRRSLGRFLLLALKCVDDLDDPTVGRLSELSGFSRDLFFHLIEALRVCMRRRSARISLLRERRARNYFRLRLLGEERGSCDDPDRAARLERKIALEKERFRRACEALSRVPRSPSHRDIARILGIPKGTVDSGLHYLKKFL